jgi:hypothetical protein
MMHILQKTDLPYLHKYKAVYFQIYHLKNGVILYSVTKLNTFCAVIFQNLEECEGWSF